MRAPEIFRVGRVEGMGYLTRRGSPGEGEGLMGSGLLLAFQDLWALELRTHFPEGMTEARQRLESTRGAAPEGLRLTVSEGA